jgi:predicted metal-dependent hydrolase
MPREYPAQYLEGLRLFNAEDFFESHEVLEELWAETQDERKKFYQGLIQAAVALFHFGNGNLGGAKKVYISCRKYLEPYRPSFEGLDLDRFLGDLQHCFQELIDDQQSCPVGIEIRDERVPKILLPAE